ncbi:MAG: UPF0182 family protein, partial [Hyphomonadaceae bacterium]|nr:UPF0182 family protein [Clostridia bacterium]
MDNVYNMHQHSDQKKTVRRVIFSLVVLAILLVVGYAASIFIELIQIREVGEQFVSVYMTNLTVKLAIQAAGFLLTFVVLFLSALWVRRNMLKINPSLTILKKTSLVFLLSFIISFIAGNTLKETMYQKFLFFVNAIPFDKVDPIFSNDIGYYVFSRPFLMALVNNVTGIWLFQIVVTLGLYVVLYLGISLGTWNFKDLRHEKGIVFHNLVNVVIWLLLKAASYKFMQESVLYSTIGEVRGAGYTDLTVWLNYYRLAPFLLIAIAIFAMFFLMRKKIVHAGVTIAIFPVVSILVSLIAGGVQAAIVQPSEVNIEKPYLEHNIRMTRDAFNLSSTIEKDFNISYNLTQKDLEDNALTVNNIRITDIPETQAISNQLQGIRNYYNFHDTDAAVYDINQKPTAVFLSVRELNKPNIADAAKTYINEKFRFTHGIGAVMNPINRMSTEGHPEYVIKDIPPKSTEGAPKITQPRIYFGEMTDDYVIVNAKDTKELDYSEGQEELEFTYDGKAGVKMNLFNRLVFAAKYGDFRMLVSNFITGDSRLLLNRQILARVNIAAPFLHYENDAYVVIDKDGRLKWVVDIYTTT